MKLRVQYKYAKKVNMQKRQSPEKLMIDDDDDVKEIQPSDKRTARQVNIRKLLLRFDSYPLNTKP